MIITRTPVRISLGGGGTDLASYYSKHNGFLLAGAINKYIYVTLTKMFESGLQVKYSKTETVNNVDELQHPTVRESLRLFGITDGIEITSLADVPSNSGLGTSSSFLVGLLRAIHAHKREHITNHEIAEEACRIEINILKEPIGKQDQYMASFGGLKCLEFDSSGKVTVTPLKIARDALEELENNILLFYTGIRRPSSYVLSEQNKSVQESGNAVDYLHKIKEIAIKTKKCLESGNTKGFGEMLDVHWNAKKKISSRVSNGFIDECYNAAIKSGAMGGKIMGAGGGGFFMFYCDGAKSGLRKAMAEKGLKEMRFGFDFEGSKVVLDI
ncbi:galactokinase [Candidatus Woesearchaeota archaeon]|nr:galactokinase [Candidatus Woesearchaeota archaeon]